MEYLENMEKHIKTIYKELLDEANSNKRLREQVTDKNTKIDDLADQVKQKADILSVFRRANELFEYVSFIVECSFQLLPIRMFSISSEIQTLKPGRIH